MANQEGVKIVITAEDRFTETMKKIDAYTKIFGETAKNTERQMAALEKEMVRLVANGMEPANKKIVEMKANYDKLSQSLDNGTGSMKKSNQQWTNLALVVQDLPYGFRGIQNNLPALMGSVAGLAGPMYLVGSAIIALFTAWDNGAFGAIKSTDSWRKSLKETNDEIRNTLNYTNSEISNLKGLVDVMLDLNTTESVRNKALKEAKEAITKVDESEGKKIKTIGEAIVAINLYSEAIQQQQMQEVIGKKISEITIAQIEKRNQLAVETGKASKGIHPINFFMGNTELQGLQSEIIANEKLLRQLEDFRKTNTKALLLNPFSSYNAEKKPVDNKAAIKAMEDANKAETDAYIKTLDERAQKEYKAGLDLISGLEKMKAAGYSDSVTYYTAYRAEMDNIGKYYDDKQIEEAKKASEKIASIQMDMRFKMQSALASINEQFAKEDVKTVNTQLEATLKATRGNYQAQKAAIEAAIIKNQEFRQSAIDAGYGTKVFDDSLVNLKAKLEGLVDPVETLEINFNTAINSIATGALVELGTQIGNVFSGAGFSMNGFLGLIADALIKLGTYLVTISKLFVAIKALFASQGVLAPWAIPIGLAAIAAGVALKATLGKESTPAFANGGIVSGPTLGLMGEYPGARNNPEVIAPLDKLQSMMGGGVGGSLSARISGNDLLILMNKTKRSNSTIF